MIPLEQEWYFPAEWSPQEAIWLTWPLNEQTWPGRLGRLQRKFADIAATISRFEIVRINAAGPAHPAMRALITEAGGIMERVELFDHPSNDVWCRDHGPIFVKNSTTGAVAATDWQFNAWGGKFPPWNLDNAIPERIARELKLPRFASNMILEGGAIEGNGNGLLITTEAVLLNENRNPTWSKGEIEAELKRLLGVRQVFWLKGGIEGDDTDGHVDDLTRFVREDVVLTVVERDSRDPNYAILMENRERLQELRTVSGSRVEIIDLPMPEPLRVDEKDWRLDRLPASNANFLILNGAVLVPVFGQAKEDDRALGILRECFPGREVIGIHSADLVFEGGAIHCISQQQPRGGNRD